MKRLAFILLTSAIIAICPASNGSGKNKPAPPPPTLIPSCTTCDKTLSNMIYFTGSGYGPGDCIDMGITDLVSGQVYMGGCFCYADASGNIAFGLLDSNLPPSDYIFSSYDIPQHWNKTVYPVASVEIVIQ